MSNASDFVIKNGVLKKYNGNEAEVVIPEGVTEIGARAFSWCKSLKSITIPDSVTRIGEYAFSGCKGLADEKGFVILRGVLYGYFGDDKEVVIPEGVTKIGRNAFFGCENLTSITIPDGVTWIGDFAFWFCEKLTIHAPAGSYAERYAKDDNIPFTAE